jgi:hypothetical protein
MPTQLVDDEAAMARMRRTADLLAGPHGPSITVDR